MINNSPVESDTSSNIMNPTCTRENKMDIREVPRGKTVDNMRYLELKKYSSMNIIK
jgi:hypothetical protein